MKLRSPVPDVMKDSIYELNPRMFRNRGVRFIMLDVDNTIAPYDDDDASDRLILWVNSMKAAGLELFILSNNHGDRPEKFAKQLNIDYVKNAKKPFTAIALQVLEDHGIPAAQAAIVGDQIYTDAMCAKCIGAMAVVVKPLKFTNIWLYLRYGLEKPFRWAYKGK